MPNTEMVFKEETTRKARHWICLKGEHDKHAMTVLPTGYQQGYMEVQKSVDI